MVNVGNWVLASFTPCELPEKIASGFDQAMRGIVGARYTPLLYTASQIVAGTNHMIICETTPVVPYAVSKLVEVYLHEALPADGGDFRLVSVKAIEIGMF